MQKSNFKVGDLVCEKNYPSIFGLVVGIVDLGEKQGLKMKVQWQTRHPVAWFPNAPEVIDPVYLDFAASQHAKNTKEDASK
jgi:hypothetical protein